MRRSRLLSLLLAVAGGGAVASAASAQATRPNIVVIVADDLGYGDLGCYGNPIIKTPRIDAMALEGARLTGFYVAPNCSPTRAALLTGAYAARVGVYSPFGAWAAHGLAPSEVTIAEVLSAGGYRTALFGKWHLGDSPDQLPAAQGFDVYFGSPWGLPARPHALFDDEGEDEVDSDPVMWTPRFVARTLDFIERAAEEEAPFFVILSHTSPHQPATASPAFVGVSDDGREYGDSVEEIDASVGAVLDKIDALGLRDDTLVIFFSDNGPALGQDPYQAGSAGRLRGWKGTTYEGGVRSPCVVRWPATTPPGIVSGELVHVVDLFDTLASLAGVPLADELPARDGFDVSQILAGGVGDPARAVHHFRGAVLESVRVGRWKLKGDELYNVAADPSESVDLAAGSGSIVAALAALRAAKAAEVAAGARPLSPTMRRSPVWRADVGFTGPTPGAGDLWQEAGGDAAPWRVLDFDPGVDLELVPTGAPTTSLLPRSALRVGSYAPRVQLVRSGADLGVHGHGAPFSVELWFRSATDDPSDPSILLDVGDERAGLSITVGDAGLVGDDGSDGRLDDMLVRVGGSGASASASLVFDLPSGVDGWSGRFTHLVVGYGADGVVGAYLDGFLVAASRTPDLDAGLDGTWALFGRNRGLGGSGGTGLAPFDATSFAGDIAGVRAFDRGLARKEAELLLCRHVAYSYCAPLPGPSGERVRLDVIGDFRASGRRLHTRVTGVGPGAFGVLLASPRQTRTPALGGYLCVETRFLPTGLPMVLTGGGAATDPGEIARDFNFDPGVIGSWNFQVWIRDGGRPAFSNALRILFCP